MTLSAQLHNTWAATLAGNNRACCVWTVGLNIKRRLSDGLSGRDKTMPVRCCETASTRICHA
jgi:hypothetical protein